MFIASLAMSPSFRLEMFFVSKIYKSILPRVSPENNVSAAAAVAAVWSSLRHIFFPPE